MIRFENVTKYYPTPRGRHYVLRDVSFHIPMGARMGIIGRNGAGKTTLLRLMGGVDTPNAGRIIREGHISWPLGLGAGLQPVMTGTENARFCCRIQGVPLKDIPAMVEGMREFSELGKFFDLPASTYSSGMKGRLKFAIAMAFDFDCYIIDELTSTGDASFRNKATSVFREKRARASFIKVTHSLKEVRDECNCSMVLEKGKLRYFDDVNEAADFYSRLIGGDDEDNDVRVPKRRSAGGQWAAPMVKGATPAGGIGGNAAVAGCHGNNNRFNGQTQAERKAQRQAERRAQRQAERRAQRQAERQALQQGRRAHQQTSVAPPPLVTSMGGPLRSSHRPAPMAPRPGKGQG